MKKRTGGQTKLATFFTSDIHFSDERIIKLCYRPFLSTQEMDEYRNVKKHKRLEVFNFILYETVRLLI